MTKIAYIAYNKRTCVTGKALFDTLASTNAGGYTWRRCCANEPKRDYDLMLRWGNSLLEDKEGSLYLNPREALINATDKGNMMRRLIAGDVRVPQVYGDLPNVGSFSFDTFVRDKNDHVRFVLTGGLVRSTDKYATQAIDKVMELRIHIFNGRTIGVYEKVPNEEGVRIYKNDNCQFRRVDTSNEEQRSTIIGARPLARQAVEALGLLFGGVDVIKDQEGNWYVLEVNSAPALNTLNIDRWVEYFDSYLREDIIASSPEETAVSNMVEEVEEPAQEVEAPSTESVELPEEELSLSEDRLGWLHVIGERRISNSLLEHLVENYEVPLRKS